ncbi:MAG: D-alanyl-D-alanine carboxypeptidase, partial [Clostridia bacterium]|nr:D-alanyl-D-alanine carboxypeptidase [Clostridia bacterium]
MKRRLTFFVTIMLIITFLAPTIFAVPASAAYNSEIDFEAEVVYMENLDQNSVIFNKNSTKRVPMASLTKITTAMIVLDKCKDLDEEVVASESAIAALRGTNSSTAGTKAGEVLTVRELLNLLLVRSANETALILAEYVAGDIPTFVQMMNDFAESLGCKDTHYVNPHGLDAEGHYSTAEDLAIIIKYALQNDTFREIVGTAEYTMPATNKR